MSQFHSALREDATIKKWFERNSSKIRNKRSLALIEAQDGHHLPKKSWKKFSILKFFSLFSTIFTTFDWVFGHFQGHFQMKNVLNNRNWGNYAWQTILLCTQSIFESNSCLRLTLENSHFFQIFHFDCLIWLFPGHCAY